MPGRVLGIDYGEKRIGLAVSDELGLIAHGLPILVWTTLPGVLDAIARAAAERGVTEVVIGLPRNMDGTLGPKAEHVERFARQLRERLHLPVLTWDERLTTVQARRLVPDEALSRRKRRDHINVVAAQLILQSYIDNKRRGERRDDPDGWPVPDVS